MVELRSLNDVFEAQLGDLYDAEKQLLVALPKLAGAAHADELREAFETHLSASSGCFRISECRCRPSSARRCAD
jgi:ferritin-like metal-binding protein YciE